MRTLNLGAMHGSAIADRAAQGKRGVTRKVDCGPLHAAQSVDRR